MASEYFNNEGVGAETVTPDQPSRGELQQQEMNNRTGPMENKVKK